MSESRDAVAAGHDRLWEEWVRLRDRPDPDPAAVQAAYLALTEYDVRHGLANEPPGGDAG